MVALVDGSKRVVVTRDAQPISLQQFPDQSLWSSWFLSTTSRQMDFGLEEGIGEVPGDAMSLTDVQACAAAGSDTVTQLPSIKVVWVTDGMSFLGNEHEEDHKKPNKP